MKSEIRLHSKTSIIVFSTIGSTLFGAILYSQNLSETNNRKYIFPSIVFSIFWSIAAFGLLRKINIEGYYGFLPVNLIGGLILAGPFWKYHIGKIESYSKRNARGPLIAVSLPVILLISLNLYFLPHKLTTEEFVQETLRQKELGEEQEIFVLNDSSYSFFDLTVPLPEYSNFYTTQVEEVKTIYSYVYYEEGWFSASCMSMPLKENEIFDMKMLSSEFGSLTIKDCISDQFPYAICADYENTNDSLMVRGQISMIEINRIGYIYFTQYSDLSEGLGDSLSQDMIRKIKITAQSKSKARKSAYNQNF